MSDAVMFRIADTLSIPFIVVASVSAVVALCNLIQSF